MLLSIVFLIQNVLNMLLIVYQPFERSAGNAGSYREHFERPVCNDGHHKIISNGPLVAMDAIGIFERPVRNIGSYKKPFERSVRNVGSYRKLLKRSARNAGRYRHFRTFRS